MICFLAAGAALFFASPALADPCEAIPERGPTPEWVRETIRRGAVFSGVVRYVGDGDMLCVSPSPDPRRWIEVRVADFYAPELREPGGRQAHRTLRRVALGREAVCTAEHRSWDRVVARCTIGGVSVGDLMRRAGVREGGRGR